MPMLFIFDRILFIEFIICQKLPMEFICPRLIRCNSGGKPFGNNPTSRDCIQPEEVSRGVQFRLGHKNKMPRALFEFDWRLGSI